MERATWHVYKYIHAHFWHVLTSKDTFRIIIQGQAFLCSETSKKLNSEDKKEREEDDQTLPPS